MRSQAQYPRQRLLAQRPAGILRADVGGVHAARVEALQPLLAAQFGGRVGHQRAGVRPLFQRRPAEPAVELLGDAFAQLAVASGDAPDIGLQQVVATGLERQAQPRVELRAFEAPRVIPRLQGEGVAPLRAADVQPVGQG